MRLTPDHVARVAPYVGDPLPLPTKPPSEDDYAGTVREILAAGPSHEDVWLFAFGSLIWNPACDVVDGRPGTAHGWRRSFCLGWDRWFRGSERHPGLMLSLDRGGQCTGMVYRLPPDEIESNLHRLLRREIRTKSNVHFPRWIDIGTAQGKIRAVTFVINRNGPRYVHGLTLEQVADALAVAAGPVGTMAEYLCSTVRHLEELGLHDRQLWRLQDLVAARIEATPNFAHHKFAPKDQAGSASSG